MKNRPIRPFIATFLTLAAGFWAGNRAAMTAYAAGQEPYSGLDTFARALTHIQEHYVSEKSTDELVRAAISGMTDVLDPQSTYLNPEEYAGLRRDDMGQTSGVGVIMVTHPEGARIEKVVPGGPAALAGAQKGDVIVGIDGDDLAGMELQDIQSKLIGARGTPVKLKLRRPGTDGPIEVNAVRDLVQAPTVYGELVKPGLGYLRIDQFRDGVGTELAAAMADLDRQNHTTVPGLVLDLRHNPGGLLDEAVAVADIFLGDGLIVATRGRSGGTEDEERYATASPNDSKARLAVLIDPLSASASEIVAGSLQDHGRAVLFGEPSYGKGSVQTYFEYEDHSALKLTIARYYLASGRTFERGKGILPDKPVSSGFPGGSKAQLRTHVNASVADPREREQMLKLIDELSEVESFPAAPDFDGPMASRLERDAQLNAAVKWLSDG